MLGNARKVVLGEGGRHGNLGAGGVKVDELVDVHASQNDLIPPAVGNDVAVGAQERSREVGTRVARARGGGEHHGDRDE